MNVIETFSGLRFIVFFFKMNMIVKPKYKINWGPKIVILKYKD
jgi:hypothetical protein